MNLTVPLWNVKKIETTVDKDETQIVEMRFHMRYNNFSDPKGYYKYDPENPDQYLGNPLPEVLTLVEGEWNW